MSVRLKRATYRHIEAEIYAYHDTLKAIDELRDEIILVGRQEDLGVAVSGGGYVGSQVERRATRLADSILLREMERITGAIRETYAVAKEEARKVVWVKYGLAIGWEPPAEIRQRVKRLNMANVGQMAGVLGIDESTFHRYRTGFVYGIAEKLGWW
jgi:RinA family phage transcriptional activator